MRWISLWTWCLRRRVGRLEHLDVQLVTRAGCHLCEDAWTFLTGERERYGFRLAAVDVDAAPNLAAQYGMEVPVVIVDGKARFRGRINPILWARLLQAEGRRRRVRREADLAEPT